MEPILGQIQLFAFNIVPKGWMVCDGAILPINQYVALFSLIGITYGGNGTSDFALPNLKGKEPTPGTRYLIAIEGVFPEQQR
jgi:microcystin-dependent protein